MTKTILAALVAVALLAAPGTSIATATPASPVVTFADAKAAIKRGQPRDSVQWCKRQSAARLRCHTRIIFAWQIEEFFDEETGELTSERTVPVWVSALLAVGPRGIVWKESRLLG